MKFDTSSVRPARSTAEIIDRGMTESGLSNSMLAGVLGTTPSVIAAIRSGRLPVPLAWMPTIAQMICHDQPQLMDWLDLIVSFCDGVMPDPQDVPEVVDALRKAIGDSMETHQAAMSCSV